MKTISRAALALVGFCLIVVLDQGAEAQGVRVRKNVASLSETEVTTLRHGIAVMKARATSDPTSWAYQADIHGTTEEPSQVAWATCQHGSYYFLSWHRMYLYYFERILRAASGDDSLTLPYWDYTRSDQRALPKVFREPAEPATNALFVRERSPVANEGGELPESAVRIDGSLKPIDFLTTSAAGLSFGGRRLSQPSHGASFPGTLERQPHNVVHVLIGGDSGWMSDPDFAARDPIFWLHHANIDRLWSRWLGRGEGRANPVGDDQWMNTAFTFFDADGSKVTMSGRDVLDTASKLHYRYDDDATGPPPEAAPRPQQRERVPESLATSGQSMELTGRTARLSIPLTPLQNESLGPADRGIMLSFEGISYDKNPGIYYEVYLGLPEGATPDPSSPYYAGNLAVFGLRPHGHDRTESAEKPSLTLDVTDAIGKLRKQGLLPSGDLPITLVPRGLKRPGPAEAAVPTEGAPALRFERVRLSTY
jgi:tyrosinase